MYQCNEDGEETNRTSAVQGRNNQHQFPSNRNICKWRTIFAQEERIVNCLFIYIKPAHALTQTNLPDWIIGWLAQAACNKAHQPTNNMLWKWTARHGGNQICFFYFGQPPPTAHTPCVRNNTQYVAVKKCIFASSSVQINTHYMLIRGNSRLATIIFQQETELLGRPSIAAHINSSRHNIFLFLQRIKEGLNKFKNRRASFLVGYLTSSAHNLSTHGHFTVKI